MGATLCSPDNPGATADSEFSSSVPSSRRKKEYTKVGGDVISQLKELQKTHPYLAQPTHDLQYWVKQCEEAAAAENDTEARDHLARIEQEVEAEEKKLCTAFKLFCPPKKDVLTAKEVKNMLDYLGFPSGEKDVGELLRVTDSDGKQSEMNLKEFQAYVAKMGGSEKLFEIRRKRMEQRHGSSPESKTTQNIAMVKAMCIKAGILDQEQAYWSLVLPRALQEFDEVSHMTNGQMSAISQIRKLSRTNHERALPELQRKVQKLSYSDNDLWMTLAYIRELAPIILHLNLTKMMPFIEKDTHYRNQFETATSGGLLKPATREKWERGLFGSAYEGAKGFDRPKYGVLNAMNDYRGVVKCKQYGDSYLVLRDCRLRSTLSPEDSANLKSERLAVLDYYAHVLNEYSTEELKETIKIAKSNTDAILGDSEKVGNMKYKEVQLHGEICFAKHVERMVVHQKHKGPDTKRLQAICAKHGWQMSWMDEERERMRKEDQSKMGEDAWKTKLKALMEKGAPDVEGVPKGMCRKGCGRKVQPGQTAGGNDFTTCCRGCALGFGHDLICGTIDSEKVRPGFCINGCGRPVNPGTSASGRKFMTCCIGCKDGQHTASCGKIITPGVCKHGCGRPVAPKNGGRSFDTCCRTCGRTKGKEHDAGCAEAPVA